MSNPTQLYIPLADGSILMVRVTQDAVHPDAFCVHELIIRTPIYPGTTSPAEKWTNIAQLIPTIFEHCDPAFDGIYKLVETEFEKERKRITALASESAPQV